jgi:rhamnosyltransferase subunit B
MPERAIPAPAFFLTSPSSIRDNKHDGVGRSAPNFAPAMAHDELCPRKPMSKMGKILLATLGSLGDLHPCLAIAMELKKRGHVVTIASTPVYREKVEDLGIAFHPMRPDWDPTDPALIGQCEDLRTGPEILFRRMILPHLRDTYSDLMLAAKEADLMLAGELVFAAPLVAEKLALPWASLILSPCSFFSSHDPSVIVTIPSLIHLRKAGWRAYRAGLNFARFSTHHWWRPIRELRRSEGLRPDCDPMIDKFSHDLVLALFSKWMAQPQPDWPQQAIQPGFVYHDGSRAADRLAALDNFLESGEPPIVFTLGSTAVSHPGGFYQVSIDAVRRLSARAILIGASTESELLSPAILSVPYAPYSQVFPRASVIVHQGGSGTTAQSMRAGRPTLFVPWGWDQPDNAARVVRQGAALSVPKKRYSVARAAEAIERLRSDPAFAANAASAAAFMEAERGLEDAANAIEQLLESKAKPLLQI